MLYKWKIILIISCNWISTILAVEMEAEFKFQAVIGGGGGGGCCSTVFETTLKNEYIWCIEIGWKGGYTPVFFFWFVLAWNRWFIPVPFCHPYGNQWQPQWKSIRLGGDPFFAQMQMWLHCNMNADWRLRQSEYLQYVNMRCQMFFGWCKIWFGGCKNFGSFFCTPVHPQRNNQITIPPRPEPRKGSLGPWKMVDSKAPGQDVSFLGLKKNVAG